MFHFKAHCHYSCQSNHQCCEPNPCLNGGTCIRSCANAKHKFYCTCPHEFVGRRCHRKRPRSCKEYFLLSGGRLKSGVHYLLDSNNGSIMVYCDFESEKEFVWTLIESFEFANNVIFKKKAFYRNVPVNENTHQWQKYRLSNPHMKEIEGHSTHVRATCNFDREGLKYIDYLRASLTEVDVMNLRIISGFAPCVKFEFINIRGGGCMDCTCHFTQGDSMHAHVDSAKAWWQCQLKSPGYVSSEDDFGRYNYYNPTHRCVSSANSTTQWWLGERL